MRVFLVVIMLVSVALIPQSAFSTTATTIDELAAMYNAESCAECHEDTHEEWKNSWHSKSLSDSRVIRTWRTFILRGLDKENMPREILRDACIKCHAPQIKDASNEVVKEIAGLIITAADDKNKAKREAAVKELSKININCLVCHNLKGAPDDKPQPKTIYGPGRAEDTSPHREEIGYDTVKSDIMNTSEFCARCHHGCPPGLPSSVCSSLWTSYQEHYLAKGGKETCQDCHMKQPAPDELKSHRFPGIYDPEQVKQGIDLALKARATKYLYNLENRVVPAVVVNVDVTNIAGHLIPHG